MISFSLALEKLSLFFCKSVSLPSTICISCDLISEVLSSWVLGPLENQCPVTKGEVLAFVRNWYKPKQTRQAVTTNTRSFSLLWERICLRKHVKCALSAWKSSSQYPPLGNKKSGPIAKNCRKRNISCSPVEKKSAWTFSVSNKHPQLMA